jgi:2-keto-4-pentenoate hydratase/2-oxohepta-3-ene-1,7-dioic acid hydratase in catechol pathway
MPSVYCLGRNYAAHAKEMGSVVDPGGEPVVFLKPWAAVVPPPGPIRIPTGAGEIHHEAEVVVRVGRGGTAEAVALGLDLTDRTRQAKAKKEGLPWATAKGFRTSACVGPFVAVAALPSLDRLTFSLAVNGAVRQRGDSSLMLRPVPRILAELDAWFGLEAGDLVFTGTPEGVGPIAPGDVLDLVLDGVPAASARFVVAR